MAQLFIGTRTITNGATAVSIDTAIRAAPGANQAAAFTGTGIGCALNFSADRDVYIGTASTVTSTGGGYLLSAGTPFTDYATGRHGNICDITQIYVYTTGADATLSVFYRAI
jgi:hypothetical protein